jgi:predicted AAA+ superfamily ATPase
MSRNLWLAGQPFEIVWLLASRKEGRVVSPFPPDKDELIKSSQGVRGKSPEQVFQSYGKVRCPECLLSLIMDVENYYASYVQTYLERDVRFITNIADEGQFVRFIRLIAARSAQELNMAALSRELEVDAKTCRRWLDILETTGLVRSCQHIQET